MKILHNKSSRLRRITAGRWNAFRWLIPLAAFAITHSSHAQPLILTQPLDRIVNSLSLVNLSVTAASLKPIRYQWRRNGVNLPGATGSIYSILVARPTDSGTYEVLVFDEDGAVLSRAARLTVTRLATVGLNDQLDNATLVGGNTGSIFGNNVNATIEPGEPVLVRLPSLRTVWFRWSGTSVGTPGAITLTTLGSDFDTLLSVFAGTSPTNLTLVASDDDLGGFGTSKVVFNIDPTVNYFIGIDGFAGRAGTVVGDWEFIPAQNRIAHIIRPPANQVVPPGSDVVFEASISSITPGPFQYQWLQNGRPIPAPGGVQAALSITNAGPDDTGLYSVQILNPDGPDLTVSTPSAFLQLRQGGLAGQPVGARIRFAEAAVGLGLDHNIETNSPDAGSFARGYSGTQIFNTTGSYSEPGEPVHCGVGAGHSQWFSYQAEDNGSLRVSTEGSEFDTVLAVYSGPGTDFASLVQEACDNDNGSNQTSVVMFPATGGTVYHIAVDGVAGNPVTSGIVTLSYDLTTLPEITSAPTNQTVMAGSNVTFTVTATGVPAPMFQWRLDGTNIDAATNASLTLTNVQPSDEGEYTVEASNVEGAVTSAPPAVLTVLVPPEFVSYSLSNGLFRLELTGNAGQTYAIQASTNLIDWDTVQTTNADAGGTVLFTDPATTNYPYRFYRGELQ